jgi:hypothetical protein
MGGWSDSKKEKAKFVIRNGQLVKGGGAGCDASVVSENSAATSGSSSARGAPPPSRQLRRNSALATMTSSSSGAPITPSGKTKFVIRDGKLVRDVGMSGSLHSEPPATHPPPAGAASSSGSQDRKALKMEPSSPRRKGKPSSSNPDGTSKVPATATFVIKDGKLVKSLGAPLFSGAPSSQPLAAGGSKQGPAAASASSSSSHPAAKAPAFSIVNGKLVKVGGGDGGEARSPKAKKSDRKEKKEKKDKDRKKSKKKSKEKA